MSRNILINTYKFSKLEEIVKIRKVHLSLKMKFPLLSLVFFCSMCKRWLKTRMSNIIILSLKVYLSEQQEVTKCYQCTNCVTPWEEGNFRNQIARCKGESSGFLCKVNIDFTNSIINALINLLNL